MELSQLSELDKRGRLSQFIDVVCCGSQRQAAVTLRVSPACISRAVSGHRPVSWKLLREIASLPNIDRDWLETGIGSPICGRTKTLTDIGNIVPIAKQLLPGALLQYEGMLSSRFIAVPRDRYGAGMYAVTVSAALAGRPAEETSRWLQVFCLTPTDILLIDTAVELPRNSRRSTVVLLRGGVPVIRAIAGDGGSGVGIVTFMLREV